MLKDILERAAERLAEDESLHSNMDDQQASAALKHALNWLESRLGQLDPAALLSDSENEMSRVVQAMRAANAATKSGGAPALQEALEKALPLAGRLSSTPASAAPAPNAPLIRRVARRLRMIWQRAMARRAKS